MVIDDVVDENNDFDFVPRAVSIVINHQTEGA